MDQKVIITLDSTEASNPNCIQAIVSKNCQLSNILPVHLCDWLF